MRKTQEIKCEVLNFSLLVLDNNSTALQGEKATRFLVKSNPKFPSSRNQVPWFPISVSLRSLFFFSLLFVSQPAPLIVIMIGNSVA